MLSSIIAGTIFGLIVFAVSLLIVNNRLNKHISILKGTIRDKNKTITNIEYRADTLQKQVNFLQRAETTILDSEFVC